MADYLFTMWEDFILEEILIKQSDPKDSFWEDVNTQELTDRCDLFNSTYQIFEEEDELITICEASLIIASTFCNVSEFLY